MKSLYQCEYCGKTFTDYEECDTHESIHWSIDRGWNDMTDTLDTMTEYKEGQEEPNVVHILFRRWNRERGEYEKRCGKFKLVSSYDAPLVVTND